MNSFVHLKVHTEYSIVDGIVRIEDLMDRAMQYQMPAVAVTDRVNLFGLIKFYKKAMSKKIKPIVGCDFILQDDKNLFLFTALCKNQTGYANLRELISKAYVEGQSKGVPIVHREWVVKARDGLIILSGGRQGDIGKALLLGDLKLAHKRLAYWKENFSDHFYIELQRTNRAHEEDYIQNALDLAEAFSLPVVATNDVRFLEQSDFDAHEARVCIQSASILSDAKRPKNYSEQQYFKSAEEMQTLFSDIPEALENSLEIAKRCNVKLVLGKAFFPIFTTPNGENLIAYIDSQSKNGLKERLSHRALISPEKKKTYDDRLQLELSVINNMGFTSYFLIVADFIQWSKQNGIPVGPGRGSGAGSLVAYALGITGLDPIEHELLFERFLNPERISLPDFDVDFCMDNRDRVIDYVAHRYGREAVSQIITYGTMAARAVIRDVGRVLAYPYGFVDKIAKLIPFELDITLEKALNQETELAKLYNTEEDVTTLIDLAKKLEGITRNAGKHAGGVVIAPTKLTDFAPLYCEAGSTHVVTQFDKDDVEAVGLVKFDFLGLRTLTIIQWAINSINAAHDQSDFCIEKIPLDDPKVFELLKNCATTAVFQLESRGMKDLMRRLQPDHFEEITALVALFRPGPLQSGMVDDFINRKHGREKTHYFHPDIQKILTSTHGVILYQEQVMQIAQVLAGYSLGAADLLRRAMGKKKPEEMAQQREIFISGAKNRGVEEKIAEQIFDIMEKFAGYGFNKSHSAAYALLAYQTAYLKAHYPAEFMAAVLSSDMDHTEKVVSFYHECESMKLNILPPNINEGEFAFKVKDSKKLTYGLGAIKGVGQAAAEHIVSERNQNGNYRDLFDFCERLDLHKVSRRTIEPLIKSGAMDIFNVNRATLLASIHTAFKSAEQARKNKSVGQIDLFSASSHKEESQAVNYIIAKEDETEKLANEKETLGMYLTGHPIKIYENEIAHFTTCALNQLPNQLGKSIAVAGLLINIKKIITKSGKRMAILTMEDRTGQADMMMFSRLYDETSPYLEKNQVYIVRGKVEEDSFNQSARLLIEEIENLDNKRAALAKRVVIFVKTEADMQKLMLALPPLTQLFSGGDCPLTLAYQNKDAKAKLELGNQWRVHPKNALLAQLKQLCGEEFVKVAY